MSVKKLALILFSGSLIFATAPGAPAQSSQEKTTPSKQEKPTPKKDSTASKGAAATQDKSGATADQKSTTTTEKSATAKKKTHKKVSAFSRRQTRETQVALREKGIDPGPIDGIMGPKTMAALRTLQSDNGLEATGHIDAATLTVLNSSVETGKPAASTATAATKTEPARASNEATSESSARMKPEAGAAAAPVNEPVLDKDTTERIQNASEVLQEMAGAPDKKVPDDLLGRAKAIGVIPHVVKGAFGVGGRYGKGLLTRRLADGRWSAPTFISIGGGSFGLQLGVSATDLVLVFTDDSALHLITGGKDLKLGADASVAAGPIGRTAEAGVNQNLGTAVYAYSRAKGLFAGIALDGAVLSTDKDTNKEVYGQASVEQIMNGQVAAPRAVKPFMDTVGRAVAKKLSQR